MFTAWDSINSVANLECFHANCTFLYIELILIRHVLSINNFVQVCKYLSYLSYLLYSILSIDLAPYRLTEQFNTASTSATLCVPHLLFLRSSLSICISFLLGGESHFTPDSASYYACSHQSADTTETKHKHKHQKQSIRVSIELLAKLPIASERLNFPSLAHSDGVNVTDVEIKNHIFCLHEEQR